MSIRCALVQLQSLNVPRLSRFYDPGWLDGVRTFEISNFGIRNEKLDPCHLLELRAI